MEWRPLQRRSARPVGRPPKKPAVRYRDFMYGAGSWGRERRVMAKVEWHQGEFRKANNAHPSELKADG